MTKRCQRRNVKKNTKANSGAISYRLKCARKAANGLSHFVMYGDVNKNQSLP